MARRCPGLVPVVKGNGYGFGRGALAEIAARLSDTVAVGTVHELAAIPAHLTPVVLTPTLAPPPDERPILTIGSLAHVDAVRGWRGTVLVKLASSVQRFGVDADALGEVVRVAGGAGLDVVGFSIHPALAGGDDEHLDEISHWLQLLDPGDEVWVSHLTPGGYRDLLDAWPDRRFRLRLGSALWHGEKAALHLAADVLEVRPVRAGTPVGYRLRPMAVDGRVLVVGAGTAHGVQTLPDGRSPFHYAQRRLRLCEPPHMHVSMVVVPSGDPCPRVGELVDVQVPLIHSFPDVVRWR
jgi:alanine racemase